MLSLIAKLKKQKEEEEKKHRQNEETAKIYAQYVKSFDGKSGEEPLKFVKSDVYDPSTGATDSTSAEIISLGPKAQDEVDHDKDELSSSYLSQIEDPQSSFKKPTKSSKVREIDKFIEEIKEKQRVINERKELHKKILTATTEYERYEINQKLSKIDNDPNLLPEHNSTNIYIGNLSPNVTEDILRIQFSKFGQIVGIRVMPTKSDVGTRPVTSAFVSFMTHDQAEKAKNAMDGVEILNVPCKIGWAKNLLKPTFPPQDPNLPMVQVPLNVVPQPPFPVADPNLQNMAFFQVFFPLPYHKRRVIDMMARYVSEGGKEFEKMVMEKESKDGLFSFVFENYTLESVYYRWRVYSLLQGDSLENWNPVSFKITNGGKVYNPPLPVKEPQVNGQQTLNSTTVSKSGYVPLSPELENEFEHILANSTSTRNDVCVAMLFIINNSESAYYLTDKLIDRFLDDSTSSSTKVALLYILSDVLYNSSCSRQYAWIYRTSIEKRLPEIFDEIKKFKAKSSSKIASQQLIDLVTRLFRLWMEWTVYSPVFMQGLEATLLGSDIESFNTSPEFDQYKHLVSVDDGSDVDYFDILSTFPYMFREDAYKYLLMGIKELKSLCSQRGLVLTPSDRVTLVKRLVMYDKYQFEKKVAEEKMLQSMKAEEELNQNANMESDHEGSDMDQDDDYESEDKKQMTIQEATAELQKVLMNKTSSPQRVGSVEVKDDHVVLDPQTEPEPEHTNKQNQTYESKEDKTVDQSVDAPQEEDPDDIDDIFAS